MGATTNEIVHEIQQAQHDLDHDLTALENRVRRETSVRVQARRHPLAVIGAAGIAACVIVLTIIKIMR
jgi:hypothetical protein